MTGAAFASLGLSGCAGFWDDVTSRNFDVHAMFAKPNPLVVLRDSHDGDERARAMRALHEPKQFGGSDAEQDVVVTALVTAAKTDPQPLCRLAAVQSLGHFKDPRAVQGLMDAFFAAVEEPKKNTPSRLDALAANRGIPPETASIIRCQCLTSLGQTKNPAAVDLLARVARPEPGSAVGVSEQEKREVLDVKIAAVRALANYSHYQSTEALLLVLQKEKDVALRDRALESLQTATGKKLGDDPKAWEEVLHNQAAPADIVAKEPKEPKIKQVTGP